MRIYTKIWSAILVLFLLTTDIAMAQESKEIIDWSEFPSFPDENGVNGAFVGVSNGALIVAGGANFPEVPVWDGGKKVWYDQIYVLEPGGEDWVAIEGAKLPQPLGNGASVNIDEGVLCIGGQNSETFSDAVFSLVWNPKDKSIEVKQFTTLPDGMHSMGADVIDDKVYVVGGFVKGQGSATTNFLSLDLCPLISSYKRKWEMLNPCPGAPRALPVVVAQSDGITDKLFVFSGQNYQPDAAHPYEMLGDAYAYNAKSKTWKKLNDIPSNGTPGIATGFVSAAPAIKYGGSHILVFGGAGGPGQPLMKRMELWIQMKSLTAKLEEATEKERANIKEQLDSLDSKEDLLVGATKFSRKQWAYHTITDTWVDMGDYIDQPQIVTKAVMFDNAIAIPMGEVSPGVRTNKILKGYFKPYTNSFGTANYVTLGSYLALIVGIGLFFSSKNTSANDFFLGGNRIPWWAAGLSIYATMLSAITYLSQPALAYASDWQVYLGYFTIIAIVPIIVMYYLPFFMKLKMTSAYEFLETRFNLTLRMFGSCSFTLFQLARMGVVVYLPALALSTVVGIDIYLAIILMGLLSIIYTVLGGIEAVIWTDVLQVVVLIGGLIIGIVYILMDIGDLTRVADIITENNKMNLFDWRLSFTEVVTWSLVLGMFALNVAPYTTDQTIIQRYMTTKNEAEAAKSIWINGFIAIPAGILVFGMGTLLFVYFKEHPDLLVVGMENDRIFPQFIAGQLPAGVAGLVIAGIFSASMSSLDSSMHSVSTVFTIDFYQRFSNQYKEEKALKVAKITTVVVGIFGTAVACLMAMYPVKSLFFLFQEIIGLFGSSLAGIFILGIFIKRANATGTIIGAIASIIILAYLKYLTPINFYIYPLIGIPACVIIGWLSSLLFHKNRTA